MIYATNKKYIHTIEVSKDMEVKLRIPEVLTRDNVKELNEKLDILFKIPTEKQTVKTPSKKVVGVDDETLLREYNNAQFGDKEKIAKKYNKTLASLRAKIQDIRRKKGIKIHHTEKKIQ